MPPQERRSEASSEVEITCSLVAPYSKASASAFQSSDPSPACQTATVLDVNIRNPPHRSRIRPCIERRQVVRTSSDTRAHPSLDPSGVAATGLDFHDILLPQSTLFIVRDALRNLDVSGLGGFARSRSGNP